MSLKPGFLAFHVVSCCVCAFLIIVRCLYRLFVRCRIHKACYRRWHLDDTFMALALLPLVGRTVCVCLSFVVNPRERFEPATAAEAEAENLTIDELDDERELSLILHVPARLLYALFLWMLKLCLLTFYSRFVSILPWGKLAVRILRWFIILSFVAILIISLVECHPLPLMWELHHIEKIPECRRAVANLFTMAVSNAISTIALVALPFPILHNMRLTRKARIQLGFLFSIGAIVVIITLLRLPFILNQRVSMRARTFWASLEILCACIVANTAFFYSVVKDWQGQHDDRSPQPRNLQQGDLYLQSLQSNGDDGDEPSFGKLGASPAAACPA